MTLPLFIYTLYAIRYSNAAWGKVFIKNVSMFFLVLDMETSNNSLLK